MKFNELTKEQKKSAIKHFLYNDGDFDNFVHDYIFDTITNNFDEFVY